MTPDEFRSAGYELIDWIADYHERVGEHRVASDVEPGQVRAALDGPPPEGGERIADLIADLDDTIVAGLTHWQSPSFHAYFPANAALSSVLGDLASSGLGVNGFSWVTSPAVTELETVVMDWMVELLGLPDRFVGNGVIQDSASSGTLCAVLAARDRAVDSGADPTRLVAYCSAQAHSSIEKGLRIAGIPAARLRVIGHDDAFAMQPDALAAVIAQDIADGWVPFFVCATAGTTSSQAFDPVTAIAEACRPHHIWVHLDAAMAGIAALCDELRWVNDGVELVDSYLTNGHKWMGVVFDCTFFWVADRAPLLRALSILPAYLRSDAADSGAIDYRDWQVPLGRRFRALKVWFLLRIDGPEPIRTMIRDHVAWSQMVDQWVRADDRFEVVAPTALNLVTFAVRSGDGPTQDLVEAINASGEALVTPTVLDERRAIRVSIGGQYTKFGHLELLWELIQQLADDLDL